MKIRNERECTITFNTKSFEEALDMAHKILDINNKYTITIRDDKNVRKICII